jgi:hypothetical protein
MDSRGSSRLLEERLPGPTTQGLFTTNDAEMTLTRPAASERKPLDKRSLEYVLRSGFAGGVAGCAVRKRPSRRDGI